MCKLCDQNEIVQVLNALGIWEPWLGRMGMGLLSFHPRDGITTTTSDRRQYMGCEGKETETNFIETH